MNISRCEKSSGKFFLPATFWEKISSEVVKERYKGKEGVHGGL